MSEVLIIISLSEEQAITRYEALRKEFDLKDNSLIWTARDQVAKAIISLLDHPLKKFDAPDFTLTCICSPDLGIGVHEVSCPVYIKIHEKSAGHRSNHWNEDGDLVIEGTAIFRPVGFLINGGPSNGMLVKEILPSHQITPHGGFSPVYIEIGDD